MLLEFRYPNITPQTLIEPVTLFKRLSLPAGSSLYRDAKTPRRVVFAATVNSQCDCSVHKVVGRNAKEMAKKKPTTHLSGCRCLPAAHCIATVKVSTGHFFLRQITAAAHGFAQPRYRCFGFSWKGKTKTTRKSGSFLFVIH